jgi:hypothetical protein
MSLPVISLKTSRALLIVVVSGVLATLSGLADASPPDPTWIPGLYDDADFDDVVGLGVSNRRPVSGAGYWSAVRPSPTQVTSSV